MSQIRSVTDLAEIAAAIDWSGLPAEAVVAAERNTLHVLGTTFLGRDRDISRRLLGYAGRSAPGTATVLGLGATVAPGAAAFVNATLCHADFRDRSEEHTSELQSH